MLTTAGCGGSAEKETAAETAETEETKANDSETIGSGTDASTELYIGDTLIYSETQGVRAVEIFFKNQGGGPGEPVHQFIYIKDENISEKIQAELPEISVVFKSLINDTTQTPKVSFPVLSK